jgi:hypothetical protein
MIGCPEEDELTRLTAPALALSLALALGLAACDDGPTEAVDPGTTAAAAVDPGIAACKAVAARADRVAAGGAPITDAERRESRGQMARSRHPELQEAAARLEAADRSGSLTKLAEANGEAAAACATAAARDGVR